MPQPRRWQVPWLMLAVLWVAGPAGGQNANVTVDDQPTAEQRLEQVLELRRAERYAEAAELIQELIDGSRFKLVGLGEGTYADASQWASDVLVRDPALRAVYAERYTALAQRALEQGLASDQRLTLLTEAYRQYGATKPGLEAGMTAAGLLLEAGQIHSAGALVGELLRHPDRDVFKQRLELLRGAVAAYRQDASVFEDAVLQLEPLDPAQAQELKQLAESIGSVPLVEISAQMDMGPKPASIDRPLWDQAIASLESSPRWQLDDRSVMPVLTPSQVLFNNGRQVVALDRASGQRSWVYPPDEDSAVQKSISAQRWIDSRAVARSQGKVAAVLGECHGITERRSPSVPPNDLVCIDEQTGKPLWQRTAADFRDNEPTQSSDRHAGRLNLQNTHFVGTPIVAQGKVFVVLRRVSSESDTQSSWLLAYDAADGSLLWHRHLAMVSLSYTNADSMRVSPQMTLHGQTIYISDSLGTIGAVDVSAGDYRWLRVLPVGSENTGSIIASTRGGDSGPIVTSAGLLVPLSLSNDRLMLVDPADGSVLRSFKQDPVLGKTQYLIATNDGALAVSQTSVSYWDAEQATVQWTFAFAPGEMMTGPGAASLRYAVLPTSQRLLVLDLAKGDLLAWAETINGAVTMHDGELYAVTEGRVQAYTTWDRVYQRLVEQVKNRPTDPSAGLSLASIALRQDGQQASVLQGVAHAMDAVTKQPRQRRSAVATHVFEQLRVLIPQADDQVLRTALYERLALLTQNASQEAAYHLDAGLFFAGVGDTQRAVHHLHAVIAEPLFAASPYELDGLTRPADAVARQKLQQLIERFGRGIYARQDAMAVAQIEELKAAGNLSASGFTAVARRFPLSPLAGQLLIEAASAQAEAGRFIAAASLYKQAVASAVDNPQLQHAAGCLLQFYLDTNRPGYARDFLERFTQLHPGLIPTAHSQAMTLQQWQQHINKTQAAPPLHAKLAAALGTPVLVKGRLITGSPTTDAGSSQSLYLKHPNNTIACHDHTDLDKPRWVAQVPTDLGDVTLLADHAEQVLFWSPAAAVVYAIDAESGNILWQTELHFNTTQAQARPAQPAPDGAPRLIAGVSETVACFADRDSAQLIAIDRASGQVLWRTALEMTELTAIDLDQWSVAVVGRAGHPQQLRSGKLALLSLADAQPLLPEGLSRIALTPFGVQLGRGQVFVIGTSGVMAVDATNGNTLWTQRTTDRVYTGSYAIAGNCIAVQTNTGEVQLFDASDQGNQLGEVLVRGGGDTLTTRLISIDQAIWCLGTRGVFRISLDGQLQWADAIQTPGLTPRSLVVAADHVAMIAERDQTRDHLTLHLFESLGGRLTQQYDIGPLPDPAQPQHAIRFGVGLAIPVGEQTLVIQPATPAVPGN